MKRTSKILTGFVVAAVTFASLFAIAGPKKMSRFHHRHNNFYEKCHMDHSNTEHVEQPPNQITDSLKTNE